MSAGAERAAAQPHIDITWAEPEHHDRQHAVAEEPAAWQPDLVEPDAPPGRPVLAGLLIILTLAWLVACAFSTYRRWPELSLTDAVGWIATVCVPPVLLGLVWLIFGRTRRAESEKFTRAVQIMRSETETLDRVLAQVAERLSNNRERLSEEATRLMQLGDEASDRLGRVTHYLSRESADLDRRSQAIESAAAQARVDVGVLLADLPQAEQAARSFSETVREAGVSAHERSRALEAQLSAIAARAQDADHATGGAAERLSAHIAHIESSAGVAAQQLEGASQRLNAAVDTALGRTTDAVESTRVALHTQAEGLLASVEQSRARFTEAGADASRQMTQRLEAAQRLVDNLSAGLAAEEQRTRRLVVELSHEIAGLDERLASLGERSEAQSAQMSGALTGLRDATMVLRGEIDASDQGAVVLIGRTGDMAAALDGVSEKLRSELPPMLHDVETRTAMIRDTALAAADPVREMAALTAQSETRLTNSEQAVARQRETLEALLAEVDQAVAAVEERMRGLTAASGDADEAAKLVIRETGPELVETLVRVREAARVAAGHAREAISAVIPESAAQLSTAVSAALGEAVTQGVRQQIEELEGSAQRAASAAREASERLTRQMLVLGEGAAALEAKIEEERASREEHERGGLARRVALLIESLNSTAIDVTKILSNDVTDGSWQAYLKGDRGVFTRRAVRLIESGEAREILRHYDQELEFREQVNRYIADFEAMLRHILADSDGNTLAVTLLSSDMGKLYVALAQAIQHLRI